jgi:stage II sporulation protein AA (anti-sigma F factor antagonist)
MTGLGGSGETFQLENAVVDGRNTLRLSGELDMASAPRLEALLAELSANGTSALTLDLSELTFMDSTGLRAVLRAKELTDGHGCELSIVPGPPAVQRLFEMTRLIEVMPWTADPDGIPIEESGRATDTRS